MGALQEAWETGKMIAPKIGGRAKSTTDKIEYGTIIEVSPNGKRYQVKWDQKDEYGEDVSMHELHPASCVRPI